MSKLAEENQIVSNEALMNEHSAYVKNYINERKFGKASSKDGEPNEKSSINTLTIATCEKCNSEYSDELKSCPYCWKDSASSISIDDKANNDIPIFVEILPTILIIIATVLTIAFCIIKNATAFIVLVILGFIIAVGRLNGVSVITVLSKSVSQVHERSVNVPSRDSKHNTDIICPCCHSRNAYHASNKGFGLGNAAVGGLLVGPIGLLGGLIGSKKLVVQCLKCGYKWTPVK